jgi:hypothetical protein
VMVMLNTRWLALVVYSTERTGVYTQ